MTEPTLGVILAGGRARRMGGADKPGLRLGGRTLLARVVERLRPRCAALILNANGVPDRFAATGLPVVPDEVAGFPGPLAGLLAGLDWAAAHRPDLAWVASAAADTPFLPRDLVDRLHHARRSAGAVLACAASGGRLHPVAGLWPVSLRHVLRAELVVEGERRIGRWAARQGLATAEWDAEPVDPFFNVNTPEDLSTAERLLSELEGSPQSNAS